ncbi:hypothetical protein EC988_007260 [Linderina pennispora]|nr:hypothetical protein EC988_007260 [Linderina pennispora]
MADLHALTFAPATSSKDAATLQKLYEGMDLTKATLTSISSLKRSECDKDYMSAHSLKDMKSFVGQKIPGKASPVFCSKLYENTTACSLDTSISINSDGGSVRSVNLNSTLYVVPGSARLISVGNPHVYEARSVNGTPCKSNGFVSFPYTSAYTDWINWATNGTIGSNGSWINKTITGNDITDFANQSGAAKSWSHMNGLFISALTIVVAAAVSF